MLGHCHCQCFVATGPSGKGICATCSHPGSLHSLVPTQLRDKSGGGKKVAVSGAAELPVVGADCAQSMLSIMSAEREPDMSLPTAVQGVEAGAVIIPPKHPDNIRLEIMRDQRDAEAQRTVIISTEPRSLERSLSLCEVPSLLTFALMW